MLITWEMRTMPRRKTMEKMMEKLMRKKRRKTTNSDA